ncbi:MAG: orotidine-5'-phosphate decarboxylase [Acidobacteriota bacterium]|nr:orotidine-5'-phosphate decarboxylase [Acidobacteriota bacterium]
MNEQNFFKRIIVALDVSTKEEALNLVQSLRETEIFKIGLKLFSAEGPELLKTIHSLNKKIFLDLKLHDIPNTVSEAVKVAVRHGVYMMTIHSSGGKEMMAKAVEAGIREAEIQNVEKPLLLAVTVLTSLNDDQLKEIGIQDDSRSQVLRLAGLSKEAGMDGIVCSPQEIEIIRKEFGKDFLVVTPGIRPSWAAAQDQKRIMTPSQAFKKGADYLVIGRPITTSPSPEEAFQQIVQELVESQ